MDIEKVVEGLPKTELIYWRDSYIKEFESELLRVVRDKKNAYLVTRATVFHAKGGGQPSDTGTLTTSSGMDFGVKKVMMADEVVVHFGSAISGNLGELKPGVRVKGQISWEERYCAMRKHTAGHLFDHALDAATGRPSKTVDSWLGDPCYVTYAGQTPNQTEIDEAVRLEVEGIRKHLPVRIEFVSHQEMLKIAGDAPNIARLPRSNLMRIVTIEGCKPIPCGGTHVKNTGEIGSFEFGKVEPVDDNKAFRVYYNVK